MLGMSERSSEAYGQHGVTWVDRFGVWLSHRSIVRALPRSFNGTVLELGCGYRATQLCALENRVSHGTGVDFKIDATLQAKPRFEFHEGSVEEVLPRLPENHYDAVLLISVLEHLRDPLDVLVRIQRVMSPGGVLLINVPTWRGKAFLEFSAFRLGLSPKTEMDDHKMYYDKRDLWPLLVKAGFLPSRLHLRYHKFGLNLFATACK